MPACPWIGLSLALTAPAFIKRTKFYSARAPDPRSWRRTCTIGCVGGGRKRKDGGACLLEYAVIGWGAEPASSIQTDEMR